MAGGEPTEIDCPYCGELVEIEVDPSVTDQTYIEDCSVCCRPIVLAVHIGDDGGISIEASREDD